MMYQMSSPKKTYVEDLKNLTTSVCWQLDDTRAVWEFDSTSQKPPKAGDWFFLVNFPRTGSTVATHILNSHRDVYCGNEHQTLPLLMTILGFEAVHVARTLVCRQVYQTTQYHAEEHAPLTRGLEKVYLGYYVGK